MIILVKVVRLRRNVLNPCWLGTAQERSLMFSKMSVLFACIVLSLAGTTAKAQFIPHTWPPSPGDPGYWWMFPPHFPPEPPTPPTVPCVTPSHDLFLLLIPMILEEPVCPAGSKLNVQCWADKAIPFFDVINVINNDYKIEKCGCYAFYALYPDPAQLAQCLSENESNTEALLLDAWYAYKESLTACCEVIN